jgi:hypothetical protein
MSLAPQSRHFVGNIPVRDKYGVVHLEHPDYFYAVCDRSMGSQQMWDQATTLEEGTVVTCLTCLVTKPKYHE